MPINVTTHRARVLAADQQVSSPTSPQTFALLSTTGNVLDVANLGVGLAALARLLLPNQVMFGSFRVAAYNPRDNVTGTRYHRVSLTWVGPAVPASRRMQLAQDERLVLALLSPCRFHYSPSSTADLSTAVVGSALLRAIGNAQGATQYAFGPSEVWTLP